MNGYTGNGLSPKKRKVRKKGNLMRSLAFRKIRSAIGLLQENPRGLIVAIGQYGLLNWIPDRIYLKLVYKAEVGSKLDLKHPRSFSEKMQFLKLTDHNDRYIQLVDKYQAHEYIAKKYGEDCVIPYLGVYDSVGDIEWDKLPQRFVIKCTHGSGCNILCKDKKLLNQEMTILQLKAWMKKNWYYFGREWPYLKIKPRIVIEKFEEDTKNKGDLTDYKFYCFEGKPNYCQVIGNRKVIDEKTTYTIDFYDMKWNHMEFSGLCAPGHSYPAATQKHEKPTTFDKMVKIAEDLANHTHFVRIDFYEINETLRFGEFTLYPLSGFGVFSPDKWNIKLGDLIRI